MIQRITIIAAIIIVASGCSKKSIPVQEYKETKPQDEVSFVTPERRVKPEKPKPEIKIEKKEEKKETEEVIIQPKPTIPQILFSPEQTQHVRLSYYDPFADKKEIVLDLDQLQSNFCYPYNGKPISRYGYRRSGMHTGLDIKAVPNDTIRAAMDGVVRMSKPYSGYGNVIVVRHSNGLETIYSHNSKNLVKPNDPVQKGQAIALAGRTGSATTEHLHFEFRVKGEHFNPEIILNADNHCLKGGKVYIKNSAGRVIASSDRNAVEIKNSIASEPTKTTAKSTHTVTKGDTLYGIARKYGTSVKTLCQINSIPENKTLSIGEKIKIK